MNIAILSIHSCPYGKLGNRDTGGMNVYIREVSRELSNLGHSVDIYTASHRCQHCYQCFNQDAIRVVHLKNQVSLGDNREKFDKSIKRIADEIVCRYNNGNLHYDIIHSHYWQSGLVGLILQNELQIPHITMFHTLGSVKKLLRISTNDPQFRVECEQVVANSCNHIIAATEIEKTLINNFYNKASENISVIPCGVNLNLFRPMDKNHCLQKLNLSADKKYFLYVGRLEPLKGIEQLLGALPIIRSEFPFELLIIGGEDSGDNYLDHLKDIVYELKSERYVKFVGSIPQNLLPYYYNAVDICIVPSYYESFCLVMLEAVACGTFLISTDTGIARNVIQNKYNGLVISDNDKNTIANAIIASLKLNNNKSNQILDDNITEYSWTKVALKLESVYNMLLRMPLIQRGIS